MARTFSKTGNGEFFLEVQDDGVTLVSMSSDGANPRTFSTPQKAYDQYRPLITENPACWNICYMLEEVIQDPEFVK